VLRLQNFYTFTTNSKW